jgi:spermidine synthase
LEGSELVRTDWNAVARSDVVRDADSPTAYRIFMDGAVPTPMEAWDGNDAKARRDYAHFIGMLPYRVARRSPERVLALGPGGGLDVVLALASGAGEVVAVDVNPALPSIVVDPRFRSTSARVYADPRVHLVVGEGRSYLWRAGQYDLIYSACALTNTLPGAGVGMVENHLYTVEAFQEYWRHLTPDGLFALVVEDNKLADRLLLTALLALTATGVSPAEAPFHVLTARAPGASTPYRHAVVVRRVAWEPGAMRALVGILLGMRLQPMHVPHVASQGALGGTFEADAPLQETAARLEAEYPTSPIPDVWPVTDDRPFFADYSRRLDPTLAWLCGGVSTAAAAALLVVVLLGRRSASSSPVAAAPLCFACLGIGFMAAETALIQRLGLPLGSPTRALGVGLGALLVGGAVGSGLSQRLVESALLRAARLAFGAIIIALAFCVLALPGVLRLLEPLPPTVKIVGAAALVGVIGLPMGVPFSSALRLLEEPSDRLTPALWGLNGVASLLGGVATVVLAKFFGYGAGFVLAIVAYALAWPGLSALGAYRLRASVHAAQ